MDTLTHVEPQLFIDLVHNSAHPRAVEAMPHYVTTGDITLENPTHGFVVREITAGIITDGQEAHIIASPTNTDGEHRIEMGRATHLTSVFCFSINSPYVSSDAQQALAEHWNIAPEIFSESGLLLGAVGHFGNSLAADVTYAPLRGTKITIRPNPRIHYSFS